MPCPTSPCNSTIFPVKKTIGNSRFVEDLRQVNEAIFARAPVVPNPVTIISTIPSDSCYFTVIDAFRGIMVHPDSQFWFAFTFRNKKFTFSAFLVLL